MTRKVALEQRGIARGGFLNQTIALVETNFGDHQPRFAEQRRILAQSRAATVTELVAAWVGCIPFGDAIGIGERQHIAHCVRIKRAVIAGEIHASSIVARGLLDLSECAARDIIAELAATEGIQRADPHPQIVIPLRRTAECIARFEEGGEIAGEPLQCARCALQRIRETWMKTQREQSLAVRRDPIVGVQGVECLQYCVGLRQCPGRWWIEEAQVIAAPGF